jgi:hypothetical protein
MFIEIHSFTVSTPLGDFFSPELLKLKEREFKFDCGSNSESRVPK